MNSWGRGCGSVGTAVASNPTPEICGSNPYFAKNLQKHQSVIEKTKIGGGWAIFNCELKGVKHVKSYSYFKTMLLL